MSAATTTEINGIYYKLNTRKYTAQVTYSFSDKNNQTYVTGDIEIPEKLTYNNQTFTVTSVGEKAFIYCKDLISVKLPNSIEIIGESAFEECRNLQIINLPSSLSRIEKTAFYNCNSLTSLDIPLSIKYMGAWAFSKCDNLSRVNITDLEAWCKINYEIVSAGHPGNPLVNHANLFLNGEQITTLIFPESLDAVLPGTFTGCGGLKKIILPKSVKTIGAKAFEFCYNLEEIENMGSITEIEEEAFCDCYNLKNVLLPETLITIGKKSFSGCEKLESINIPSSVKNIGETAFLRCNKLNAVYIEDLEAWLKINFELYSNPLRSAHRLFLNGNEIKEIIIPFSIDKINSYVFQGCYSLENVVFHDSISEIGSFAFAECKGLKNVVIPSSVLNIGSYAFCNILDLENVFIGSGVTYIGVNAFSKQLSDKHLNLYITALTPPSYSYSYKDIFYDDIYGPWSNGGELFVSEQSYESYISNQPYNYFGSSHIKTFDLLSNFSTSVNKVDGPKGKEVDFDVYFTPSFLPLEKMWISGYDPEIVNVEWNPKSTHGKIIILDDSRGTDIVINNLYPTNNSTTIYVNGGSKANVEDIYSNSDYYENFSIFNLQGICLKQNATQNDIDAIPPGFYIINGKKILK